MSIELQKIKHTIELQHEAEEAFLKECNAGSFTFDKPYVKVNPYIIAPLTAIIHFKTDSATSVAITVKGKEKAGDMSFKFPKATEHFLPVLGLYGGHNNKVELTLDDGKTTTVEIKTDALADNVHTPTSINTTSDYMGDLVVIISPTSPAATAAYDYKGDVRWYGTLNFSFDVKRVKNGRLLLGTQRLLMPPYHTTGVYEMGMIGKIYKEYRLPGGYHHDQIEMEDGNLLVLTQDPPRGTVEDMCVLIDRKTGKILKRWDYQTFLPQDCGGSGSQDAHDWFHNNSVWFDKKTNSLTFSGRHQDIVVNIDYDTSKLNWIIGDPEGWPQDMQKYFFKPVGDVANFDWQYEQHSAVVLPDGDIMCFDNGHYRAKVKEKYVDAKDNFSRGVRYRIDTKKMEIEQVWQYGKERGAEFFSTYICNVEYYGEGHYMVHSGGTGSIDGIACNRPPVSMTVEAGGDKVKLNSITVEIKDNKVVYEMQVPGNYYRAEKLPLYCDGDRLSFGKGEILGTLGITEEFDTIPDVADGGLVPDQYKIKLAQEADRLVMKGSFEKGQLVMLILEGDKTHAYFIPTTNRPFLAMCVGTFLESDERAVETPISFENISGKFKVKMVIDDKKYDTGVEINV